MNRVHQPGIVIIGGGHAGFTLAAALRTGGYVAPVRIVSDEAGHPYERPPLSKAFLLGKRAGHELHFRDAEFYAENGIELIAEASVESVSPAERTVSLSDGRVLPFDHLVFATGAQNRVLDVPGAELGIAMGLRNVADADAMAASLAAANNVAVIGGGFIGLEVAAAAAQMGKSVTVVEAQQRLLARAVPQQISDALHALHESRGVRFLMSTGIRSLARDADGRVRVDTGNGVLSADAVVAGVGVIPNVHLARDAGLATDDGIVVDEHLRTADPAIYAIGDCARCKRADGRFVRIESVQNAADQARHVAGQLLGHDAPHGYKAVPWFWSDQYDVKLQIVGLPVATDTFAVREQGAPGTMAIASIVDGAVAALHTLNSAAEHMFVRKKMTAGEEITAADLAERGYALSVPGSKAT